MKTQPNPVYFSDPTGLAGQGGCSWCNPVADTFDREIMDASSRQPSIGSLFDGYTGGSFTGGWGRGYGRLGLSDRGFARADAFFGQKNAEAVAGEFLKKNGLEFKDENGAPIEIGAGTLFTIGVVGLGDGNGNITKVLGYRIYADEGFQQSGGLNLSGSPDEVYNGLINIFNNLYEGPFVRQPNDNRGKNFYHITEFVKNPPSHYNKGDYAKTLASPELYTTQGIKFRWAISPVDFNKASSYLFGYLSSIQSNDSGSFGAIHLLGTDGHAVLTLTIYGRDNFVPVFNSIYKGYKKFN